MRRNKPIGTIGYLSPYLGGVYFGGILAGVSQAARQRGLRLLVVQGIPQEVYRSRLAWDLIDGWIVVVETEGIELLAQTGVPVVTVSKHIAGLPAALADNRGGTCAAVRHLIEHGHRRIAFLGSLATADVRQRFEGYTAALAEANIPLDLCPVVDVESDLVDGGFQGARQLIEQGIGCTAIVTGTDENALGLLEAVRAAGYRVPTDLAIVGFDDVAKAQVADPPLTTVRQRCDSLGSAAVDLLLAQAAGDSSASEPAYVPTALVVRRSCGCEQGRALAVDLAPHLADAQDWQHALAHKIVRQLLFPVPPDPAMSPAQIWPGVDILISALEAALLGRDPLPAAAIVAAWHEALALTTDLDVLDTIIDLLEQVGKRQLDTGAYDALAHSRLTALLRSIRKELVRAYVARETAQAAYLDSIVYAHNEISAAILDSESADATQMTWLRYTPAQWGCLGIWSRSSDPPSLTVRGAYSREDQSLLPIGERCAASAFPPIAPDTAATSAARGDMTVLLPIRTSRNDWGVLALGGAIISHITLNNEPLVMCSSMLGTALDCSALLSETAQQQAELREQQATLRLAYERERALASTVRELGCPVIPLLDGVLLIPLIGAVDSERAQQIIKMVLGAVSQERATAVLIDVTGVPLIDTQVAGALVKMAQMIGLLGARAMLVGVRPEIAQSIVGLGVDLAQLATCPTLASAIRLLQHQQRAARREEMAVPRPA
jgi:DNA-binding LacI/PurR family transcriptional regulator/anti-anti-sigma regulatory factor